MRRALISVSNKGGLSPFAGYLLKNNWEIVSTGGTYDKLVQEFGPKHVYSVEEITGQSEFLGGRVKTLNAHIHGGILARPIQLLELMERKITPIDMVIANLYPFEQTVASAKCTYEDAIENIDIGGVTMIRGAAKNHERVSVITDPNDYPTIQGILSSHNNEVPNGIRRSLALAAFKLTAQYDAKIAEYLSKGTFQTRMYEKEAPLKYGCNPHQSNSAVWKLYNSGNSECPIQIINGNPSYINYLDAINSWQLVRDLQQATGKIAAASFKHTSPAGVGIANEISNDEFSAYDIDGPAMAEQIRRSAASTAYIRARNGDPKSSFGDFIAISGIVDETLAQIIKFEVSDGIVAAGYTTVALKVLSAKKNGKFIILKADAKYTNTEVVEFREMFGMAISQQPDTTTVVLPDATSATSMTSAPPQSGGEPQSTELRQNLLVANIALKYAQSNSVAIAKNGQIIGLGCGQQNRVDCVKLAGEKAKTWHYRLANANLLKEWKSQGLKRQARVNKMYDTIELQPETLQSPRYSGCTVLASDGFFPFPDNIERAAQYGVTHIIQPGGSSADDLIAKACAKYGIEQYHTGRRVFYH